MAKRKSKPWNARSSLEEMQQRIKNARKDNEMANMAEESIYELEKMLRETLELEMARGAISQTEARQIWQSQNIKWRDERSSRGLSAAVIRETAKDFGYNGSTSAPSVDRRALEEAKEIIDKQNEILNNIKEDALIMHRVDRVSKDGKYTFVSKNGTELRVKAPKGLKVGHEVLLHPKTMQVVEDLGFPPLEASQFSPGKIPGITWDDIGGLQEVKRDMIEAIELPHKNKELFAFYNKRPVKGILLSGSPGCGKTMLGKAAANSLAKAYGEESVRTGFLYVKAPEILNQYVGQTEQTIRDIFIDANRHHVEHGYPAVIFIDEADAILATRGTRNVGIGNTIVPAFLTEMDGLETSSAIVILATNRPDILDPAIVREGRIDRKVHVPRPDIDNAILIAKLNLAKFPVHEDFELDNLAEGMAMEIFSPNRFIYDDRLLRDVVSGAMIASCADLAVSSAVHRDLTAGGEARSGVTGDDVIAAVDRIQEQNRGVNHDFD